MSNKEKAVYVREVINALGLAKAVDTIIGDAHARGISGGERKRVSVGVELISNPSLLFLDEPTSGLDSFQALSVMGAMQGLAKSGRTIVAAIHQPRSSIFDMIDYLVLVSEGQTIFAGPAASAKLYFERHGYLCPENFCPSDFFLDVISMDYRSPGLEAKTAKRIEALAKAWEENSASFAKENAVLESQGSHSVEELTHDSLLAAGPDGSYQSSWPTQFVMLFQRSFAQARRNKFALTIKTVTSLFFGLVIGAIYSESAHHAHSQRAVQNFIGVTFFVSVNQAFGNVVGVINTFPLEKVIVQKELASKAYRLSSYYLAKLLSELPFNIIGPLLFSTVSYWIVGMRPEVSHFLTFIGLCMLEAICAVSLGVVVSAVAPDVPSASALAPPITIVFMLFSGLFVNVNSLPQGAQWCPYFSFIKWAFQAYAINQFKGYEFDCEPGTSQICTGDEVLASYSLDQFELYQCVLAMLGITASFITLGYILLRYNSKKYLVMTPPAQVSVNISP